MDQSDDSQDFDSYVTKFKRDGKNVYKCNSCGKEYLKNVARLSKHALLCAKKKSAEHIAASAGDESTAKRIKTKDYETAYENLQNNGYFKEIASHEVQSSDVAAMFFTLERHNKYKCQFCLNIYTRHATKMCYHISRCRSVPQDVRIVASRVIYNLELKRQRPSELEFFAERHNSNNSELIKDDLNQTVATHAVEVIDQDFMWKQYMRAVIASRIPFSSLNNIYWKQLFQSWHPACPLPTKEDLLGRFLDEEYLQVKQKVDGEISEVSTYGIQICNRSQTETAFYVSAPNTFFFKMVRHEENSFNDFEVFQSIKSILCDLGANKCLEITCNFQMISKECFAVIKQYIQQEDLAISVYPYADDCLQHLLSEILHLPSFVSLTETLQSILVHVDELEELKEDVKMHMTQVLGHDNYSSLTEFFVDKCFNLPQAKTILKLIVCDNIKFFTSSMKNQIFSEPFWTEATKFYQLIEPLKSAILAISLKNMYLSDIVQVLSNVKQLFDDSVLDVPITEEEREETIQLLNKFREVMLTPAHFAANILDPRYVGKDNSAEENQSAVEFLLNLGKGLKLGEEDEILSSLGKYRLKEGQWKLKRLWDASVTNPRLWWGTIFGENVLTKIANALFLMNITEIKSQTDVSELDSEVQQKIDFIAFNTSAD